MNYRAWQLKNADTAGESALLAAGYGPLLARVLACRGIAQPQAAAATHTKKAFRQEKALNFKFAAAQFHTGKRTRQ